MGTADKITITDADEKSCAILNQYCKALNEIEIVCAPQNGNIVKGLRGEKEIFTFQKPFRLGALHDQILNAQNQKIKAETVQTIKIGQWTLDPTYMTLTSEKNEIRLTEKERDILVFLSAQNGVPVLRDQLLKTIWEYAQNVETHTLETHIYRLRQKIEIDPANPQILITNEYGYILKT